MEINHISSRSSLADESFSTYSVRSFLSASKEVIVNCKHSATKDIYCKTHHMLTCRTCLIKQHGLCDVQAIEDLSKECDNEEIENMIKEIISIKVQINETVKEIGNKNSMLVKEKLKAIKKIKDFRIEMQKHLEAMEKEALQNLDCLFDEYKKSTEEHLREAEQCLTSHTDSLKSVTTEDDQSIARIVECKESQKAISETREALHKLKIQIPDVDFFPDQKLLELMPKTTPLGMCLLNFKRDPTVLYKIAEKRQIRTVPEKGSNNCNITGAARLPSGHILLTDRSNKKLLRLECASHRIKDCMKFSSEPWAVCVIHATEAAVSFPEEQNNVKFISIANKMKVARTLKLRHTCRGLVFDGEELFVTDQGVFVYVYTLNGTLLRKFSKDGHAESKLTDFYALTVRDTLIVVADWNEGLLAFDRSGKLIWKYCDHELKRVSGICFDETGNILACGSQSINVLHINKEGKKIGEIANTSNGLLYPTALCFDDQKSLLTVAQQEANTVLFRVH